MLICFSLPVLQEKLAELTDIPAGDQLILWTDRELCNVIDTSLPLDAVPRSISRAQLFLVSRSCMDNCRLKVIGIRKLRPFKMASVTRSSKM